jgi:chromosome segregation ATPase
MTREDQSNQSRRSFLRTAALTAVAATAAGAGAVKLTADSSKAPTIIDSSPVIVPEAQAVLTGSEDLAELFSKLAAAQAENVRLKAELDAAQRNLSNWQQTNSSSSTQMETMSVELDNANQEISVLSGLVALYEQLDDVDVSDMMADGLTAVSESINSMVATSPLLNEGIEAGQQALDELEAHLPLLENGRMWLERHNEKLQIYFDNLEELLQKAVDTVEPFLEMLTNWFADVRKWLPFNLGQKAVGIMESATMLLSETPHTVSGLNTNVVQPLDQWLAYEDDDIRLRRTLIKPMREKVIGKASEMNLQAETVKKTYDERLAAPLETAVAQRRALRETITQYRQQNQL